MDQEAKQKAISDIARMIEDTSGLHFPPSGQSLFINRVETLMKQHDITVWSQAALFLSQHPDLLAQLIDSNMPHETQFFRVQPQFRYLQHHILPALKQSPANITIWSAATSNGAEAYSIAILLREAGFSSNQAKILATDIEPHIIQQAKAGIYTKKYLQNVSSILLARYFSPVSKNKFRITDDIRAYVNFRVHNLVQKPWPWPANSFDLIFLEHVLIYFSTLTHIDILKRVEKVLKPGGYLFTSYSELIPSQLRNRWQTTIVENAIFHRPRPEPLAKNKPIARSQTHSREKVWHAKRQRVPTLRPWQKEGMSQTSISLAQETDEPVQQSSTIPQPARSNDSTALAWRYYEEGKQALDAHCFQEAIEAMDKALYINDRLAEAALVKAGILKGQGKTAEALRTYQWVLKTMGEDQRPSEFGTLEKEAIVAICRHSIRQLSSTGLANSRRELVSPRLTATRS